jgi:uncharacterized DUF497 family protein
MIIRFTWDENKNIINQVKHGVSFNTAKMVFTDPNQYEILDSGHSTTEKRWKVIGLAGWEVLVVIFTERDGFIRIISARKANKTEQEVYFNGYGIKCNRH